MNLIQNVRALCLALPEEHPGTDWGEVAELIATSYCLIAPKRLAQKVTTPPSVPDTGR